MGGIAYWLGALLIRFPDSSRGEKPRSEVELRLTRNGLEILKLEMKDQTYMIEMCKKAVDSWILTAWSGSPGLFKIHESTAFLHISNI